MSNTAFLDTGNTALDVIFNEELSVMIDTNDPKPKTDVAHAHHFTVNLDERGSFKESFYAWDIKEIKSNLSLLAERVDPKSAQKLSKLIDRIYYYIQSIDIPQPDVELDSEGDISLAWFSKNRDRSVAISIDPETDALGFDLIMSEARDAFVYDNVNEATIIDALKWFWRSKESWSKHS